MLVKFHMCIVCKRQDAYTLGGRKKCAVCTEKNNEYMRKRRQDPEYRKRNAEKDRERRERYAASGICMVCGKRKPKNGCRTCQTCLARYWGRRERKVYDEAMCWTCRKQPHIDGKKMCQSCYDRTVEHLRAVRVPGFGALVLPGSIR